MRRAPLLCVLLAACMPDFSVGSRAGTVSKLSEKGFIWKSWEGELVMGGITIDGNGAAQANVFQFNADPSVVPQLQAAMSSGKRVELVYHQWGCAPPSIDNSHVVTEVR